MDVWEKRFHSDAIATFCKFPFWSLSSSKGSWAKWYSGWVWVLYLYFTHHFSDIYELQVVFTPQAVFSHLWIVNVHTCNCLSGLSCSHLSDVWAENSLPHCAQDFTPHWFWLAVCRFCLPRLRFYLKLNSIQLSFILRLTSDTKINVVLLIFSCRKPSTGTSTQPYLIVLVC